MGPFFRTDEENRILYVDRAVRDESAGFAMKRFGSGVRGETVAVGSIAIPYEKLSGYELYEDGKLADRGGAGIAKVVSDRTGRRRSIIRSGLPGLGLLGSGTCHSLKMRILITDDKPVTVDFLPKPVPRKSPQYLKASGAARRLGSEIVVIIDRIAEERREEEAARLLNYVKGRENTTSAIVSEAFERYRRGEITEDEFQRIKYQTLLNPQQNYRREHSGEPENE